jgi:hypothetical protein
VASPKSDTVIEAGYFADKLKEHGITVRGLIVNRMQPSFPSPEGAAVASTPEATRLRAATLSDSINSSALADHYTCLADARALARGEESHLTGLTERVAPAPVVRVSLQPFEVTDLGALSGLGDVVFGRNAGAR